MDEENWPIAIDPPECGCTECMIGQYVPLNEASHAQVIDMLLGKLDNHLSDWENEHTRLEVKVVIGDDILFALPPEQAARVLKRRIAERYNYGCDA